MTTQEQYVIALVLGSITKVEAYTDISVEMALNNDWSAEERMQLRDAAGMVLRSLHPEVPIDVAARSAIAECLGTCGGSV